jgi:hypothetical protein
MVEPYRLDAAPAALPAARALDARARLRQALVSVAIVALALLAACLVLMGKV